MIDSCSSHDMTAGLLTPEEAAARRSPQVAETRPRRLLLCLDGVPFDVITAARSRGLFDNFRDPARLLSPFPTVTNVALAEMLKATPPQGYESLYFDRDERRLAGGVRKYIGRRTPDKIPSSYMDELDYQEPLHFEFLIYVAPDAVWRADMRRFRERFRAAPAGRDFFAFLKATDGLLHCRGPRHLEVALESLDRILRGVQAACGEGTEIVVFSDHGMNLEENRRVHLQTYLKRGGFDVVGDLRERGGGGTRPRVAAPGFGLCGYAAIYCGGERDEPEVAGALSTLEGVDFSVRRDRDSGGVLVEGARGRARVRRREDGPGAASYAYERIEGDPLRLAGVAAELEAEGLTDAEGFAPDAAWLARTAEHEYPDALSNLYHSLHAPRVRQTADVLVSLRDGYYYGATAFGHMIRLLATHGNALRPSTTAFLMSTHRDFPRHVRAAEARPFLK